MTKVGSVFRCLIAAVSVAVLIGSGVAQAVPAKAAGALGANYNEHFEDVDTRDLDKADAKWVRLFLPMPQLDRAPAADHGAIRMILNLGRRGYRTILTLKYPYNRVPFPSADGVEFRRQVARTDAVLPLVMGKVDVLVIGNEPFIESRQQDWNPNFNRFYERLARRVIDYRTTHCAPTCRTRLYMGALNQLEKPEWRNATTDRWMAFVKQTPELDGVNIHPHVSRIEASKAFLDYILPRMRPEQTFLATEFSLIWWWQAQMQQAVAPAFADRYQLPRTTQNWEIVKAALVAPFPRTKWDDFLRMSPWFETRKHYLTRQMAMFRATGRLAVATYGFRQGASMSDGWGPKKTPWLINSVYAGRTAQPNPDGSAAFNYAWIDDFRAMQR